MANNFVKPVWKVVSPGASIYQGIQAVDNCTEVKTTLGTLLLLC